MLDTLPDVVTDTEALMVHSPEVESPLIDRVKAKLVGDDVDRLASLSYKLDSLAGSMSEEVERTKVSILEEIKKIESMQTEFKLFLDSLSSKDEIIEVVDKVIDFYSGEKRKSGEPVIYHMLSVASILKNELGIDSNFYLKVALLHDVKEDRFERVRKMKFGDVDRSTLDTSSYGKDVDRAVEGLSKFKTFSVFKDGGVVHDLESYTNLVMIAKDYPGILYIKLADRLHNMRTSDSIPFKKKAEMSKEIREFYLPVAKYLKIDEVVQEMEEKCRQLDKEAGYELEPERGEVMERKVKELLRVAAVDKSKIFGTISEN